MVDRDLHFGKKAGYNITIVKVSQSQKGEGNEEYFRCN